MDKNQLLRCAPEAQGIHSDAIRAFVEAADREIDELHSFMLLRHGAAVAEGFWRPYAPERPHMLFSLSKSFTSTAVGLAIAEGCLGLDDRVLSFFPDEASADPDANLQEMRIRHLLAMNSGHDQDTSDSIKAAEGGQWVKAFLSLPVEHAPGTHFVYNSGASYMLSAILQKRTGMPLVDYLQPRLFEPLGIAQTVWENSPEGINVGGWGLSIRTEEIARFGQLYLQKGTWEGRQILPAAWVETATSTQSDNSSRLIPDWTQGYGYQFWRCRFGAYRGDGAFGQFCIVLPEQDAVLAITGAVNDMQAVLNLAWEHLLPAFKNAPLPENSAALGELEARLAGLALTPPQGQATTPAAQAVSGRTYRMEPNDMDLQALSIEFGPGSTLVKLRSSQGEQAIVAGQSAWVEGTLFSPILGPSPAAVSGTWTAADTYQLTMRFIETPFYDTRLLHFNGGRLRMEGRLNVNMGPVEYPTIEGQMD